MVVGCGSQMLMREDTVPSLGLEGGQEVCRLVKGKTPGPHLPLTPVSCLPLTPGPPFPSHPAL